MRTFLSTLLLRLRQRHLLYCAIAFFALGIVASWAFRQWIPLRPDAPPLAGIAATTLLLLLTQALAIAFLGVEAAASHRWPAALVWIKNSLFSAAGMLGIAATGVAPSTELLFLAWLLCAAFSGILCAVFGLAHLILRRERAAIQIALLVAILMNSALFWSRAIITDSGASDLADGVMKCSPPLALAAVWYQQSSSNAGAREDARFDIIRSPLTYEIWVGSYQAVPYPDVLPKSKPNEPFEPGLLLVLLLWGIPVLVLAEALRGIPS